MISVDIRGIADERRQHNRGNAMTSTRQDTPLSRRIVATLQDCPGGMARADLLRVVSGEPGATTAAIEAEINRLLLSRRIGTANRRLYVS